jgi:hypothetical protein
MVSDLEFLFPKLRPGSYRVTSPRDKHYNCIGWAIGSTSTWWWPSDDDRDTWPPDVPREESLAAFEAMFRTLGYELSSHDALESGIE